MKTPQAVTTFRRQFPQLRGKLYFNHAASAVAPMNVVRAAAEGAKLSARYSIDAAVRKRWARLRQETREMAAGLIGAHAEDVALVPSTSVALSRVALAIPWKRGDNVVTATVENPATVVPWQNLRHLGIEVRYLPADADDMVDVSALPRLVDRRTRLVALSLVQYASGQRLDIAGVAAFCRARGILVSVDGVQAVGAVPVDVEALGADFLASGAQKWLLGPRDIGILYVRRATAGAIRSPIVTEANVPDIKVEEEDPTTGPPRLRVNEGAAKLEATPCMNFAGVPGLHQALANIRTVGAGKLHRRLHAVTDELAEGLAAFDGRVVSPRDDVQWSGIVSFAPATDVRQVAARLLRRGAFVAVRKGRLRISPHWYNTSAEVQSFLRLLRGAL